VRLRTQLIIFTIMISFALTATSLLLVRFRVRSELSQQTADASRESVRAFEQLERRQEEELARTAELVAELPTLKAVMATQHSATIQDVSRKFWELSGADLLVLSMPDGNVMAIQASQPAPTHEVVQQLLTRSLAHDKDGGLGWWHVGTELFRVVNQPVLAGTGSDSYVFGRLIVGRRINRTVAERIAEDANGEIVLTSGDATIASTLSPEEQAQFAKTQAKESNSPAGELKLGRRHFQLSSVNLQTNSPAGLRCYILLPLDSTDRFIGKLNRSMAMFGAIAALMGILLVMLISRAITQPLERLVNAVRALAMGDDKYSLDLRGTAEVVALARDFGTMRRTLVETQQRRLDAERLAAMGRAAGFLSHDLRHHLTTMIINAEFLYNADMPGLDRDEIYDEVVCASEQMTLLLDSLLEVSHNNVELDIKEGDLYEVINRAKRSVCGKPQFRKEMVAITAETSTIGCFDAAKLERVFFNLLLNGCEAGGVPPRVGVAITGDERQLECRVWDNGTGIPASIRSTLFDPFVSVGKSGGTGLGLTIASKLICDHGGEILIEETSSSGTTLLIRLPRRVANIRQSIAAD
jgi:signal transduction histidine kinase